MILTKEVPLKHELQKKKPHTHSENVFTAIKVTSLSMKHKAHKHSYHFSNLAKSEDTECYQYERKFDSLVLILILYILFFLGVILFPGSCSFM